MNNRQWLLESHPKGSVARSDFRLVQTDAPARADGQTVLVRHEAFLCAPTIRNWISGVRTKFLPSVELGRPVLAPAVGIVVESEDPRFPVGARVAGTGAWQDYGWVNPNLGWRVIPEGVTAIEALGALGSNALTAYFGVLEVARPAAGEQMLVSGAAGSVGSMAVQIARLQGARVVAVCGSADKARWLTSACRVDAVINYREEDVGERLDALFPDGIDAFYDNVGGPLLSQAIARMRLRGRIALCGQIATYDSGIENPSLDMMRIIYGRIRMQGFLIPDYASQYEAATAQLRAWIRAGEIVTREDVRSGFDDLPDIFATLFRGENAGTLIVRIVDEEGRPL